MPEEIVIRFFIAYASPCNRFHICPFCAAWLFICPSHFSCRVHSNVDCPHVAVALSFRVLLYSDALPVILRHCLHEACMLVMVNFVLCVCWWIFRANSTCLFLATWSWNVAENSQINNAYLTLPYLMGKACYRLALRPPMGPMRIPELTVRLLKPLGIFSKLQEWAPMFLSYFTWK